MGHVDYPHMVIHSNCHSCILRDRIIFIGTGNIDSSIGYDDYQCIRFSQYRIKGYFPEQKKINIAHMDTKGSFPYVQNSSDTDSQPPIPADYSPKFDESYLNSLIEKASPRLKDVDPVQWLDELRRED